MGKATAILQAAKAIQARKANHAQATKSKEKPKRDEPTQERQSHNDMTSAGLAYRVTPPIETMLAREQITSEEFAVNGASAIV